MDVYTELITYERDNDNSDSDDEMQHNKNSPIKSIRPTRISIFRQRRMHPKSNKKVNEINREFTQQSAIWQSSSPVTPFTSLRNLTNATIHVHKPVPPQSLTSTRISMPTVTHPNALVQHIYPNCLTFVLSTIVTPNLNNSIQYACLGIRTIQYNIYEPFPSQVPTCDHTSRDDWSKHPR